MRKPQFKYISGHLALTFFDETQNDKLKKLFNNFNGQILCIGRLLLSFSVETYVNIQYRNVLVFYARTTCHGLAINMSCLAKHATL